MKIKKRKWLGTGEMLPCWESCILPAAGTKIGCNRRTAPLGLALVYAGRHFPEAEHANTLFPIWASLSFGAHGKLLQPTAVWSQTSLNLAVICRNLVSRWSRQ